MRKQTKVAAVLSAAALLALGASMTSFAASGWTQEDGEWVYLKSDGERAVECWKRSGDNYYWLDGNGLIAKNQIVEFEGNYYYVNDSGARLTNQWVTLENSDDVMVNDRDVNTLYYYVGATGRAYKAEDTKLYKNTLIDGKRYFFDEYGHMVTGWLQTEDGDRYYLGEENEGWAVTGWKFLEIPEDIESSYDVGEAWFNFQPNGKARKDTRVYLTNAYYAFDEYGVMLDDWVDAKAITTASATKIGLASTYDSAFYNIEVGNQGSGWVHTYEKEEEGGDVKWFYMESGNKNTVFNRNGKDSYGMNTDGTYTLEHTNAAGAPVTAVKYSNGYTASTTPLDHVAAKVIKGKTFLFDKNGAMLTGVFVFDGKVAVDRTGVLQKGLYYFDTSSGASEGRMVTSKRTTVKDSDGESHTYYFKKGGEAVHMALEDGSVYDGYGIRIEAQDGNANQLIDIKELAEDQISAIRTGGVDFGNITVNGSTKDVVYVKGSFIVSSTGKIRKGNVTIDDVIYTVDNYVVVAAKDKTSKEPVLGRFENAVAKVKGAEEKYELSPDDKGVIKWRLRN